MQVGQPGPPTGLWPFVIVYPEPVFLGVSCAKDVSAILNRYFNILWLEFPYSYCTMAYCTYTPVLLLPYYFYT
jgi:hypothetical protein